MTIPEAIYRMLTHGVFRTLPRAQGHLHHYRYGRGRPLEVSTQALIEDDAGVAEVFHRSLSADMAGGKQGGVVAVPQWQFANFDWRCALGGVQLHWCIRREGVYTWFRERYQWHPAQPRPTRFVHRALDALKQHGARAFDIVGSPTLCACVTTPPQHGVKLHPLWRRLWL